MMDRGGAGKESLCSLKCGKLRVILGDGGDFKIVEKVLFRRISSSCPREERSRRRRGEDERKERGTELENLTQNKTYT